MKLYNVKKLLEANPSVWKGMHKRWGTIYITYRNKTLTFCRFSESEPFYTQTFPNTKEVNYASWGKIRHLVEEYHEKGME